MPGRRASVKNEKQYEALKDKGKSKERAAKIGNTERVDARREELRLRRERRAGRNGGPEEDGGAEGRQGDNGQEVGQSGRAAAMRADGCNSGTTGCQSARRISINDGGVINTARARDGRSAASP